MATKRYLEQWYDPGLELPSTTIKRLEKDQAARIARALAIIINTYLIKHRLGPDATREELALDKKRARRVQHALKQSLGGWTSSNKLPDNAEIRQLGAQLDWAQFHAEHTTELVRQRALIATWAVRNEERVWGRQGLLLLNNELVWLDYAMRG